jgi:peroxiredoxin
MTIAVGDLIPDVTVRTLTDGKPEPLQTGDVLGKGKVVLFGVPGAFTPGCSRIHLPGYVENAAALRAKGVDVIACVSVNDAWVMDAWGRDQGVGDDILMLADGTGEFTRALGLEFDMSGAGLGVRSQRYAAILDNGIVTDLQVEPKPGVDLSSCESILGRL